MNKISKKIVALVTMAAFVLTLVPAAAFAADTRSSVQTAKENMTVTMPATDNAKAEAEVTLSVSEADANHNVVVWLTDENGNYYRYATASGTDVTGNATNAFMGSGIIFTASAKNYTVKFDIPETGKYTVHAGVDLNANAANVDELSPINAKSGYNTITVEAASTYVDSIKVTSPTVSNETVNGGTINYAGTPNGIIKTKVVANVVSKYSSNDGVASSDGKVLTVESPTSQIAVLNADGDETNEISIDGNTATFYLKAASGIKEGNYTFNLSADDVNYRLSVQIGEADNTAASIEVVDTGKTVFEKTTGTYVSLEDVAQFTVKNADGDVLTPANSPAGFSAYNAGSTSDANNNNVAVLSKPENCNPVFKVVASTDEPNNFALQVVDASELAVGKYTVRVSLDNGKVADVSFTVAKFGKVVDMTIDVDDTVVVGKTVTGTVQYVDENGLTKDADSTVAIGYSGNACASFDSTKTTLSPKFVATAKNDEKYLGAVIKVTAVDENRGLIATKDITVTDGITNGTLKFDGTNGPAFENNTVNVSVVDEDGNVLKDVDGAKIYAYVDQKGDEKANITVTPGTVNDGKGKLTVYSDKATTADIVVAVKDSTGEIYASTLSYTFGEEDVNADKIVAMTIGSTDMIVDNNIVNGDAAPYVADGRTMVPIRALSETFGAEVNYDNDAKTVTIVDGDTTIVMTIGETTYTVNGEEQTMDVAPVIGSGDRTYVPVRFVAEALGYEVTPLYAADGTTASVYFTM